MCINTEEGTVYATVTPDVVSQCFSDGFLPKAELSGDICFLRAEETEALI